MLFENLLNDVQASLNLLKSIFAEISVWPELRSVGKLIYNMIDNGRLGNHKDWIQL